MASHKYEVGQNVRFKPNRTSSLVGSQEGTIVRLLPIEEGSYLYRIKCVAENVERVAKEGDLALRNLSIGAGTIPTNWRVSPNEKATR
jgi:hypothetical protein